MLGVVTLFLALLVHLVLRLYLFLKRLLHRLLVFFGSFTLSAGFGIGILVRAGGSRDGHTQTAN